MKTVIATILLFFAITSQLGTYAVYLIQQKWVKEDMARQIASHLPDSELVKIQDSKNLDWEEEGKEFFLDHQFYDIVKTEKINGVVWYYCINDNIQTKLYNDFAKTVKSNNENTTNPKDNKYHVKLPTSYFIVDALLQNQFVDIVIQDHELLYQEKVIFAPTDIIVPPPQQI